MINQDYHKSVLMAEVLEYLVPQDGKTYIDATFGGGGHTTAILEAANCEVVGIDWDVKALDRGLELQDRFADRLHLLLGNFASLYLHHKNHKIPTVDGILADFGTSQDQIFTKDGFSVHKDSPLDMRMSSGHYRLTAADIVNQYPEDALSKIFYELGEERSARPIAKLIVEERKKLKIMTTGRLAELVVRVKGAQRSPVHPATKVFQALRMYVNHELENINSFLQALPKVLNDGARVVCISFHSLEDREVKHFFKDYARVHGKGRFEILTPKVVTASPAELKANPSARSACLRAAIYHKA